MQAHQLRGQTADRCRRALFTGKLHRCVQILEQRAYVPLDRLETVFRHLRGEDLQRLRIGKAAGQRFGDQAGINPGTLRQRDHFGNHQCIASDDHLIARLGHLPCPDAAHVCHTLPQVQQHRPDPLQILYAHRRP